MKKASLSINILFLLVVLGTQTSCHVRRVIVSSLQKEEAAPERITYGNPNVESSLETEKEKKTNEEYSSFESNQDIQVYTLNFHVISATPKTEKLSSNTQSKSLTNQQEHYVLKQSFKVGIKPNQCALQALKKTNGLKTTIIFNANESSILGLTEDKKGKKDGLQMRIKPSKLNINYDHTFGPTKILKTDEYRIIGGIKCRKIINENSKFRSVLWEAIDFKNSPQSKSTELLFREYFDELVFPVNYFKHKGQILSSITENKITGEKYHFNMQPDHSNDKNQKESIFSLEGYKIIKL